MLTIALTAPASKEPKSPPADSTSARHCFADAASAEEVKTAKTSSDNKERLKDLIFLYLLSWLIAKILLLLIFWVDSPLKCLFNFAIPSAWLAIPTRRSAASIIKFFHYFGNPSYYFFWKQNKCQSINIRSSLINVVHGHN